MVRKNYEEEYEEEEDEKTYQQDMSSSVNNHDIHQLKNKDSSLKS
jgi:hypothetical protein